VLAVLLTGCGRSNDVGGGVQSPRAGGAAPVVLTVAPANLGSENVDPPDPEVGQQVFMHSCATCHGFRAQGLPHQGVPLRTSAYVAQHDDASLVAFIKKGRSAQDPSNASGMPMPPRGNNPALSDERLADVVSYLRQVQAEAKADAQNEPQTGAAAVTPPAASSVIP
jgi:mono/diheme cytochrome c family protein